MNILNNKNTNLQGVGTLPFRRRVAHRRIV